MKASHKGILGESLHLILRSTHNCMLITRRALIMIQLGIETLILGSKEVNSLMILRPILELRKDGPVLPVELKQREARAIALMLEGRRNDALDIYSLYSKTLKELHIKLDYLCITDFENHGYRAEICLIKNGERCKLPVQLTDILAIALEQRAKIFVEDEILAQAGMPYIMGKHRRSDQDILADFKTFLDSADFNDFTS